MTTIKGLAFIALLAGGSSLAMAQNGPPTGGYPPAGGDAGGNPATSGPPGPGVIPHDAATPGVQASGPSPYLRSAAPPTGAAPGPRVVHHQTPKHTKMYMHSGGTAANAAASGGSGTHKGRKKPALPRTIRRF